MRTSILIAVVTICFANLLGAQTAEVVNFTPKKDIAKPAFLEKEVSLSYLRPITYQGGREAIQEIINQHLVYPELAREHAIEGSVMLQFSIDTSGKVSSIQVTEKVGFGCDKEALRIAQFLTSWIPAQTGPNLVPSTIYLPIQFGLR